MSPTTETLKKVTIYYLNGMIDRLRLPTPAHLDQVVIHISKLKKVKDFIHKVELCEDSESLIAILPEINSL